MVLVVVVVVRRALWNMGRGCSQPECRRQAKVVMVVLVLRCVVWSMEQGCS